MCMICVKGNSKLLTVLRKLAAFTALIALLLPGISPLAESLSAANLPACCNTVYCPMHHRQMGGMQKDKGDCGAMGAPGLRDSSMQACGATSNPVVGTAHIILATPVTLRIPATTEATTIVSFQNFPLVTTIPLTPPPQFLLS